MVIIIYKLNNNNMSKRIWWKIRSKLFLLKIHTKKG